MNNYGEKIARLRKSKGMTQEELGKKLNVTYQAVSKWERGESLPDFPTMSQLAKFFEVPLDYFEEGGETAASSAVAAPAPTASDETATEVNNFAGICTVCGKMLTEDEIFCSEPKIICKKCNERQKQEAEQKRKEEERKTRIKNSIALEHQLGSGFNARLVISIILALAGFIALSVMCFKFNDDSDTLIGSAFLLAVIPPVVFACVIAFGDMIAEMRDKDDYDGYTLKLSLIVSGIFAAAYLIMFIILYIAYREAMLFGIMAVGIVVSFTFVSQIMWGSALKAVFTCGGFTFKLPGFIFSLSIDSIIWMLVTKLFLGIISVLLFIATTILLGAVAIFGSVFTFIPCLISKMHKDNVAKITYKN